MSSEHHVYFLRYMPHAPCAPCRGRMPGSLENWDSWELDGCFLALELGRKDSPGIDGTGYMELWAEWSKTSAVVGREFSLVLSAETSRHGRWGRTGIRQLAMEQKKRKKIHCAFASTASMGVGIGMLWKWFLNGGRLPVCSSAPPTWPWETQRCLCFPSPRRTPFDKKRKKKVVRKGGRGGYFRCGYDSRFLISLPVVESSRFSALPGSRPSGGGFSAPGEWGRLGLVYPRSYARCGGG